MSTTKEINAKSQSVIKDINLAPDYHQVEWVMGICRCIAPHQNLVNRPLAGKTVACCLHLEAKTGFLLQTKKRVKC